MAPELWEKKAAPQSDIFSLAVIVYELLTGSYPFHGQTPEQILAKQLGPPPRPPISPDMHLPMPINAFVLKALSRDMARRHQTTQEFVKELLDILQQFC